jgi:homoserine O-acetyltransferase
MDFVASAIRQPHRPSGAAAALARDLRIALPPDLRLGSGDRLRQDAIHARLHGPQGAPVVIVAGGISADRFVHRTPTNGLGWWSGMVGRRAPVDLNRCQVLTLDYPPEAGPGRAPVTISTHDQARLFALVLDRLELDRVAAFVGCSYGGMVALAFAELFPLRLDQLVVISAAHRAHPQATAWRGVQRRILQLAAAAGREAEGVALARELAMITYRTAEEFGDRFAGPPPPGAGQAYPVCDYLIARGRSYRHRTSPGRWLSLSDSMDRHSVAPEAIRVPATVVGFSSDRLVPVEDMRELAARLPLAFRFVEAPSRYGHDAFLKEDALLGEILRTALKDIAS